MTTAPLSSKGQLTVPKEIRDFLKIKTGDTLNFTIDAETNSVKITKKGRLCPACEGSTIFENFDMPCFVCHQNGFIDLDKGILHFILMRMPNSKYKVSTGVLNQKMGITNNIEYYIMPKVQLFSQEYPVELLDIVQDSLQMMIIEEFTPKSVTSDEKFKVPNDIILEQILDLFVTDNAKGKVREWFRYERTSFGNN